MPSDFIDRAKLEAEAEERYPESDLKGFFVAQFMAGVDATLALLDAETTEEWGVRDVFQTVRKNSTKANARKMTVPRMGDKLVSRHVIYGPWLPSEGGEKP